MDRATLIQSPDPASQFQVKLKTQTKPTLTKIARLGGESVRIPAQWHARSNPGP
jgi:hypothetical protein